MPGKETCDMFIRNVSVDIRDRVTKYCRQQKITLRDFIENALHYIEGGPEVRNEIDEEALNKKKRISEIKDNLAQANLLFKMKKDIIKMEQSIPLLHNPDVEMKLWLEFKDRYFELNEFIKKIMPDRQIPDDPEERRKMGLPERYCEDRVDIPRDYVRNFGNNKVEKIEPDPEEAKKRQDQLDTDIKDAIERTRRKIEEDEQKRQQVEPIVTRG
jgi:hypothetical protein